MNSLGSSFPTSLRKEFSERAICPGSVFRFHIKDTNPPKTKRFVVLAISDTFACVGYILFNSEINPNIFQTQALRDLHLPMSAERCGFLDRDSYLDCSGLLEINLDELKQIIAEDPGKHIGNLDTSDLEKAKQTVKIAPTVKPKLKKKYNLI